MRAGGSWRLQDPLGRSLQIESRDIDSDAALEQFDILRQIADMLAQRVGRPMLERRVVELDLAAKPRPDPNQRPCQRRFARSTRTDDPDSLTTLQPERNVTENLLFRTRGRNVELFNHERFGRCRKSKWLLLRRQEFQQLIQPGSRLARADEPLPVGDRH